MRHQLAQSDRICERILGMKIGNVLADRRIQIDLSRFHHLHDADIGKQFRDRTHAIHRVRRCRNLLVGILIAEALRPHDLVAIDQSNRECGKILVTHLLADYGFQFCCDRRVIATRQNIGSVLCTSRQHRQERSYCGVREERL